MPSLLRQHVGDGDHSGCMQEYHRHHSGRTPGLGFWDPGSGGPDLRGPDLRGSDLGDPKMVISGCPYVRGKPTAPMLTTRARGGEQVNPSGGG